MYGIDPAALRVALDLAPDDVAAELGQRLRPEIVTALTRRYGLPEDLVEAVLPHDTPGLRAALAPDAGDRLRLRAATMGEPRWGRELYDHGSTYRDLVPGLRAAVLAAADPADPGWYATGGLVPMLTTSNHWAMVRDAANGPFPEVIAHILRVHGALLPPASTLRLCARHAELAGTASLLDLAKLAGTELASTHPELEGTLRDAAAAREPVVYLRERATALGGPDPRTADALVTLRTGGRVTTGVTFDAAVLRSEHARLPFQTHQLLVLSGTPDCPPELLMAAFREAPHHVAQHAPRVPFEVLTAPEAAAERFALGPLLRRGISEGWLSAERVLAEVTPAHRVLARLPVEHEATRAAVRELVAPLGDDPALWLTLYVRLPRVPGTAAELIADVLATTRRPRTWPRPMAAQSPVEYPENSRAPFNVMLACAPESTQTAVLPVLDQRALQHFLVHGRPSRAVVDAAIRLRGPEAHQVRAAAEHIPDDVLEEVLAADDPATDAALFRHDVIPPDQRARVLAGVPYRGGPPRPVPGEVLDAMRETNIAHYRARLLAGIDSGDPGVARVLVERVNLRTEQARLRVVIAVWERHGPDAARAVVEAAASFPATTRRRMNAALDNAPDGLGTLRAALEHERGAGPVAAFLRKNPSVPEEQLGKFLAEGGVVPWDGILAAHREKPFAPGAVSRLADREDCPAELVRDELAGPERRSYRNGEGLVDLVQRRRTTLADVLELARPAESVLPALETGLGVRARRAALDLTRAHLGGNTEAWVVALRMYDGFTGSLTELAATAGAVAGG